MNGDLRVEEMHGRISIYDKLGGGHIELSEDEAEYAHERLGEILDG